MVLERLLKRGELSERDNIPPNLFANGFRATQEGSSHGLKHLERVEMVTRFCSAATITL